MTRQKIILTMAAVTACLAFGVEPSAAKDYPFCRKGEAGPGDCRYDTYEQCLAAVSGTAGYCQQNFWLAQPDPGLQQRRSRRAPRS